MTYAPLTALLFDLDGTLLDTDAFISGAFDASLKASGAGPLDREAYRRVIGQPLATCYAYLAPGHDAQALCEHHRVWQTQHLDLVRPMPGAGELLVALRERGILRAVVTTRSRRSSIPSLERTGLLPLLDTVVSAEDVSRHKPDPEPLLLAISRLNVAVEGTVMVGDTPADVNAARAAGVLSVGVDFGSYGPAIAECQPDLVISNLVELLPALDRRIGPGGQAS